MTEYITKEQFQKMADEQGLVLHHTDQEKARRLVNLAFEHRLEVVGYVTSYQTNAEEKHLSIGFNPTVRKLDEGSPLYALKGDSK
jgi:hypothetical protein